MTDREILIQLFKELSTAYAKSTTSMNKAISAAYKKAADNMLVVVPTPVPTPTPTGVMPTPQNTGPGMINGSISVEQWISSGTASNKTIVGQLNDVTGRLVGRTLTANHCVIQDGIFYQEVGTVADANLPRLVLNNCRVEKDWIMLGPMQVTGDRCYIAEGAFWSNWSDGPASDHQDGQRIRPLPVTFTNSMFHKSRPPDGSWYHSEALHIVSGCQNMLFTNVRFTQDGPWSNSTTGCMKVTAVDSKFIDCWWDWNGQPPGAYYAVYLEGRNVQISGKAQPGAAGIYFPEVWSPGPTNNYVLPASLNLIQPM